MRNLSSILTILRKLGVSNKTGKAALVDNMYTFKLESLTGEHFFEITLLLSLIVSLRFSSRATDNTFVGLQVPY
jgi:hypothetical protein